MENDIINEIIAEKLKSQIRGVVVMQTDSTYHEDRKLYNGMIQKYPTAIVKCANGADVLQTVNFCRENRLVTAIRSGGHNGAGLGSCNDGIVIDLSLMKGIHIDPDKKTARVEAGCLLGDVDQATSVFGLAVPSGIFSTTGVGGLTLGGGLGYLTRKYGLTIDNLLEADMVLADGRSVTVNEDEHPDLFWAIRGGGGNFGVVTSFLFQLHPVSEVYAGPIFWEANKAKEVMQFYRDYMKTASNDLYGFFTLMIIPASAPFPKELWNKNVCAIVWNYTGEIEKANETFKPIREFATPVLDFAGPIPFKNLQSMFDAIYPHGLHWYWKADYLNELSDEAIEENIKFGTTIPTPLSQTHIYPIDGLAGSIPKDATAWNYRNAKFAQVIVAVDTDQNKMENAIEWCKSFWEAIHPHSAGGAYSNFMMEEGQERVKAAYGDNYKRLAEVKLKYDPDNFFRVNQNIEPAHKKARAV
jgi:FAD/FMN-containing dehydrogenase